MINLFPHFLIKFIYIQSTLRGCCKVEFSVQCKIDNLTLNHQETNCTYVHYLSCIRASHCLSSPSLLLEYVTCRSSAWSRSPCSTSIIDLPTSDKSSISLQVVQQLLQILGSFMKRLLRLHLSNFEMCFSKVWDFVFFNLIGSWKEEAGRGGMGSISLCVSWARELNSAKPKWQCSGVSCIGECSITLLGCRLSMMSLSFLYSSSLAVMLQKDTDRKTFRTISHDFLQIPPQFNCQTITLKGESKC